MGPGAPAATGPRRPRRSPALKLLTSAWRALRELFGVRQRTPLDELDVHVERMTASLGRCREQVTHALVDQRRLRAAVERLEREADERTRAAEALLLDGDEGGAREALVHRLACERRARELETSLAEQDRVVAQLKDGLRDMTLRLDDARRKRNLLAARARTAEARRDLARSLSSTDGLASLDRLGELERQVLVLEAEADGAVELMRDLSEIGAGGDALPRMGMSDPDLELTLETLRNDVAARSPGRERPGRNRSGS